MVLPEWTIQDHLHSHAKEVLPDRSIRSQDETQDTTIPIQSEMLTWPFKMGSPRRGCREDPTGPDHIHTEGNATVFLLDQAIQTAKARKRSSYGTVLYWAIRLQCIEGTTRPDHTI